MNETIGVVQPEPGAGSFGPNVAWSEGEYLGQIDLAAIVDARLEIERLALRTIEPYAELAAAAAKNGIQVSLNSGFRSYPEQKNLHDGFVRGLPGFNTAAKPGFSKHQKSVVRRKRRPPPWISLSALHTKIQTTPSPVALADAMDECQPLAWAVRSIYAAVRWVSS